jgi:putative transposase
VKKRFSIEQITALLQQAEQGVPVGDLCRKVGISEQSFYRWKKVYGSLQPSEARELKQLREENTKLKRLVADLSLDKIMLQDVCQKNVHARCRTRVGMKVVASGSRASRAKVDAYWCSEPGKKWTRVPRLRHPVLLSASRQGLRSTPGKLSPCGTPRRASPRRCGDGSAVRPWSGDTSPRQPDTKEKQLAEALYGRITDSCWPRS